jgi:hypothetical protein
MWGESWRERVSGLLKSQIPMDHAKTLFQSSARIRPRTMADRAIAGSIDSACVRWAQWGGGLED